MRSTVGGSAATERARTSARTGDRGHDTASRRRSAWPMKPVAPVTAIGPSKVSASGRAGGGDAGLR